MLPGFIESVVSGCKTLVEDQGTMASMQGFGADLLLGDVLTPCTWALSDLLR